MRFLLKSLIVFAYLPTIYALDSNLYCARQETFIHKLINSHMIHHSREITVLEIGAHAQGWSFELEKQYGTRVACVLVDSNEHLESLYQKCSDQNVSNIILLGPDITPAELQHMSECEHFDVVIVHDSFLNTITFSRQKVLESLLNMGDYIIFNDLPSTYRHYKTVKKHGIYFGSFYVFDMHKKYLERSAWGKKYARWHEFAIQSSFKTKKLYKRWALSGSDWIKGINLLTAKNLRIKYPTHLLIRAAIQRFANTKHNDLWIGNMVIQGKNVQLIDFQDRRRAANPVEKFPKCLAEFPV